MRTHPATVPSKVLLSFRSSGALAALSLDYLARWSFYIYPKGPRVYSRFKVFYPTLLLGRRMHKFYLQNIQLRCRQTRRTLTLLSSCHRCRHRLIKVEFGFGVREVLELFDLQVPVFVGNEAYGEDRFAGTLNPD
jgi:hypothetical protein